MAGNSPVSAKELGRMYHAEQLTLREMGGRLGAAPSTVSRWLEENDIDRRTPGTRPGPINLKVDERGYPFWKTKISGERHQIRVHRLLAVAKYGVDAVIGNVVHHKNGVPWDNRPENIEVMSRGEHVNEHRAEWEQRRLESIRENMIGENNRAAKLSKGQVLEIRKRYDAGESALEIAGDYPISADHARIIGKRQAWAHIGEQD